MDITICGPNLNDQSKGEFHVHATNCSDLKRHAHREPEYAYGMVTEATTRLDAASYVYEDHMAESEPDSPYSKPEAYLTEFHFFPCCKDLA